MEQLDSPKVAPQSPIQTPLVPQDEDEQDEHVLPAEEQPLSPIVSPTTESPEYVAKSDPEEYEDDETEDGPVDYPMDGGDGGDDDDGDSSGDDVDDEDEDEDEEDEEEKEEPSLTYHHPSLTLLPLKLGLHPASTCHIPSTKGRGECLARCTAPYACPSPPPVPSPLLPSSKCPTQIQTLRLASTQALIDAVTAAIPSPSLPPPLYIPPPVDRRDDIPKIEMPPRKSTLDVEARRRGIEGVRYGIRDTWVDLADPVPEIAPMTVNKVNTKVTEFAEITQDLYALP
nr:hypothetical protein [Tanacetum cinerariifolium]